MDDRVIGSSDETADQTNRSLDGQMT